MDKPNLLWEITGYDPIILFSLEPVKRGFRTSLSHDISRFHYFLESQFGCKNVRDLDFTSCKSLLKSRFDLGMLFHIKSTFDGESNKVSQLKAFDCNT